MFGVVFGVNRLKLSLCIGVIVVAVTAFCALFPLLDFTKYATKIQCIVSEKCVEESFKQVASPTIKKKQKSSTSGVDNFTPSLELYNLKTNFTKREQNLAKKVS